MITALAPALAALALPVQTSAADLAAFFPPAKSELRIAWEAGASAPTMRQLLDQYVALTGQNVTFSQETSQFLDNARVPLAGPVAVPASEVQSFVESLLVSSSFCLSIERTKEPRLLNVQSLQTAARNTNDRRAITIAVADIDIARQHPAILFTTSLNLPNTDVRQVSNSLRTMITDANTQQLLPAGNSTTMVLTGFGPVLASFVDLLRTIDAASAVPARPQPVFEVIPLRHAAATELAPVVEAALAASGALASAQAMPTPQGPVTMPTPSPRAIADPRSNSLVVACWPEDTERVKHLVAQLDVELK